MASSIREWLNSFPGDDQIQARQAVLVRILLLALGIASAAGGIGIPLTAPIARSDAIVVIVIILMGVPTALVGLLLLRRGRFHAAVLVASIGQAMLFCLILAATGIPGNGATIFAFAVPIVLTGLLARRWQLVLTIGLCGLGILVVMLLESSGAPLIGIAAPRGQNMPGVLGGFVLIAIVLSALTLRFGQVLRMALAEAHEREQGLQQLQHTLEATVAERTGALEATLAEAQQRAEAQARLLDENAHQRELIRAVSVPVLPVDAHTRVLPLVGVLDGDRLRALQDRALAAAGGAHVRRLILDIGSVPFVDEQVASGLLAVVAAARLRGTEVALVGIRPEVAQALVSQGIDLEHVRTYADLEAALHRGW